MFQNRIAIILGVGIILMIHSDHGIAATWQVVNVPTGDTLAIRELPTQGPVAWEKFPLMV